MKRLSYFLPILLFSFFLTACVQVNPWKISYESDYGVLPEAKEVNDGYILTSSDLPELEYEGYEFKSWKYKDSIFLASVGHIINKDVTLSAVWNKLEIPKEPEPVPEPEPEIKDTEPIPEPEPTPEPDPVPTPVPEKDITPPADVKKTKNISGDTEAIIGWENPSDSDFAKIIITYTTNFDANYKNDGKNFDGIVIELEKEDAAKQEYKLTNLTNSSNYRVYIYTVDTSGNISSGVIYNVYPKDLTPPAQVSNVSTEGEHLIVWINFCPPKDDDLDSIYIISDDNKYYNNNKKYVNKTDLKKESVTFKFFVSEDKEYTFSIYTVDTNGNVSEPVIVKGTAIPLIKIRTAEDLKSFFDNYIKVENGILMEDIEIPNSKDSYSGIEVRTVMSKILDMNSHTINFQGKQSVAFDMTDYSARKFNYTFTFTDNSPEHKGKIIHNGTNTSSSYTFEAIGSNITLKDIEIITTNAANIIQSGTTQYYGGIINVENCKLSLKNDNAELGGYSNAAINSYGKQTILKNNYVDCENTEHIIKYCNTTGSNGIEYVKSEIIGGTYNLNITNYTYRNVVFYKQPNFNGLYVNDTDISGDIKVTVTIGENIEKEGYGVALCFYNQKCSLNGGTFTTISKNPNYIPVGSVISNDVELKNGIFNVSGKNGINLIYDIYWKNPVIKNKDGNVWDTKKSIPENLDEFIEFISPVKFNNDEGKNYVMNMDCDPSF